MASKNQKKYLDKNPNLIRHYGLRKLSVGVASVVLGTTAVLGAAQTAKADTADNGQGPAEASQTASSTPDPASDGNQGNSYNNNTNSFVPDTLPQGESESDYVSQYADQMTQQSQPAANNENTGNQTQAAPASSQSGQSDQSEQTQEFQINNNEQSQLQTQQEANVLRTSLASDPDSGSGNNSSNQSQGQEINDSDYQILSHKVTQVNGSTPTDKSYVDAHVDLQFDNPSQIKNGDYIDVHLGIQMSDGTREDYSNNLNELIPVKVNGIQIGQIIPVGENFCRYYRLVFNENMAEFKDVNLSLDFNWYNDYGTNPIEMTLYSSDPSIKTYTPTNDLTIGNHSFSSGFVLSVSHISNNGQAAQPNFTVPSFVFPFRYWSKSGQVKSYPIDIRTLVVFPDNMSHDITVTVAEVNNNLFQASWYSDDEIARAIQAAIRNYNAYTSTSAHVNDSPNIGTFTKTTSNSVPTVTVTDSPATIARDSNYQVKSFHIKIGGNDPLKFGNVDYQTFGKKNTGLLRGIIFGDVTSREGVDTSPADNITTLKADEDSSNKNAQQVPDNANEGLALINNGNRSAGYALLLSDPNGKPAFWVAHGYLYGFGKGSGVSNLKDKALQDFMYSHAAGWTKVHDNTSNKDYKFGGDFPEAPFYFGEGKPSYTLPTNNGNNQNTGTGTLTGNDVRATIKYIDDTNHQTLMTDSASGQVGSSITFNNDVATMIKNYESLGYKLASNNFKTGQTFSANAAENNFEVHFTKPKEPAANKYSLSIVYKLAKGTIIQTVPNILSGNYPDTIPADQINNLINSHLPKGYKYVSGRLTQPEAITNADPTVNVIVAPDNTDEFSQDIIYQTNDGKIIKTVPNAFTGTLTNGQATVSATTINSAIDADLPSGYEYISGKVPADEVVQSQTPKAITVIVKKQQTNPQSQTFSQNIVYETASGMIIETVPNAISGPLTNGQAVASADSVNSQIDAKMPAGYTYVSGKLTSDELITSATPADIIVIVQDNSGNGNGNNGNNTGGNGNGNNGNNTGGNGSNPNNNGGNGNGNNGNNTGGNGSNPNNNGGNGNSGNNAGGNGNGNNVTPINPFIPTNNGGNGSNTGSNGFNGYSGTGYNGYYNGGYARRGYGYGSYSQAVPTGFTRGGRSSAAGLNTQQVGFRTRLPQTGTNDNSELMAMALGLGALLLSGGLAGADKHRYNN